MNIWYIHHYATPDTMPGLHRPFEFGKYFIKNGHKLTVFSSSYLHYSGNNMIVGKEKYLIKSYDGVSTVFIKTCEYDNSGLDRIKNMLDFFKNVKKVAKSYSKENGKPDIIIASSPHPLVMMAGNYLAKKYNIPSICEVRDFWPEVFFTGGKIKEKSLLGKILLKNEHKIYKKATALLFLKEGDHEYIKERKWDTDSGGNIPMSKCYYVNNGVDIELFDKRKNEFAVQDEDLEKKLCTVVYCGTIRPVNHVDILVDVGKKLGEEYQILLYGNGNCVDDIKQKIEKENVTNVKLKGYIDNKYVPYILSKSSINILNYSSKDYNWSRGNSSNKLFEYLASGKPVVSTVKMGYDILERFNCGVSATQSEVDEIVNCIKQIKEMQDDKYLEMCKNARIASEQFDIPTLAEKYLAIIFDVVRKYKGKKTND